MDIYIYIHIKIKKEKKKGMLPCGYNWNSLTRKFCRLDGEHVAFGKVIEGMDTVFAIEGGAGTYSGKPRKKVIIVDSGEIPKSRWDEDNSNAATSMSG